ncbi:MAG: RNA polymerase factor sigma-54, partial [Gammaproteobacteria bacterium]
MKQSLQLRIGQSLTMTPQLQQAIKLLQLSSLELQTEIQQTLETNPLLEQDDNLGEITVFDADSSREGTADSEDAADFKAPESTVAENRAEQQLPDDLEIDARWDQIYDNLPNSPTQSATLGFDTRDLFENQAGEEDTLKNHLIWQLDCSHLPEKDYDIGLAIIDSIDDSGYLTQPISDIYEGLVSQYEDLELDEVEAVLHLVQRFDPVGVAASSPGECM